MNPISERRFGKFKVSHKYFSSAKWEELMEILEDVLITGSTFLSDGILYNGYSPYFREAVGTEVPEYEMTFISGTVNYTEKV
jgi:hypothetical protein